MSLSQKRLLYRKISKTDLCNLDKIFFAENVCGKIDEIEGNGWESICIETEPKLGVVPENFKYGEL